jgi:hypothetical protein
MKRSWPPIAAFSLVTSLALILFVLSLDSHHSNWRHLGWKWRVLNYDPAHSLRYFNVDREFRQSLLGRPLSELHAWFPDLRPASHSNARQKHYLAEISVKDVYWIGDTTWAIIIENDRVAEISLHKG